MYIEKEKVSLREFDLNPGLVYIRILVLRRGTIKPKGLPFLIRRTNIFERVIVKYKLFKMGDKLSTYYLPTYVIN